MKSAKPKMPMKADEMQNMKRMTKKQGMRQMKKMKGKK